MSLPNISVAMVYLTSIKCSKSKNTVSATSEAFIMISVKCSKAAQGSWAVVELLVVHCMYLISVKCSKYKSSVSNKKCEVF